VLACTVPSHDVSVIGDDVTPRTAEDTVEDVPVPRSDTALQRRPNADGLTPLQCAPDCSQRALNRINQWRGLLGLSHLTPDPDLQTAAANHTAYYLNHWESLYEETGRSAHDEVPGYEGYTGIDPWYRISHAGYPGVGLGEVMAFQIDPERAVDDWFASLYHRTALILPVAQHFGHAGASRNTRACQTVIIGAEPALQAELSDQVVLFPPDGAIGVPTQWDGQELPQPPLPGPYPSGPIMTAVFASASPQAFPAVEIVSSALVGPEGPVAHVALETSEDEALCCGVIALYAAAPLLAGAKYEVTLEYKRSSVEAVLEWGFETAGVATSKVGGMLDSSAAMERGTE
jgi:uncharacterized protein YkwD